MCDCFKPAFSDYDFGFGLGVGGDNFTPDKAFAYSLFAGVDFGNNNQVIGHLTALVDSLTREIDRASAGELTEIPQFGIYWSPIVDFQNGYVAGLSSFRDALMKLLYKSKMSLGIPDIFEELVLPWSDIWQSDNSKYDFLKVEPFAEDGDQWQIRVISITRSTLVTDLNPDTLLWLECESFSAYPVEELISEVWKSLGTSDKGIGFCSSHGSTGPVNLEQTRWSFEIGSICDKHWNQLVKLNSQLLAEAGIDAK